MKIANLKRQKRQHRVLMIAVGSLGIALAVSLGYIADLQKELKTAPVVACAAEVTTENVFRLTTDERELVEQVVAAEARGENFEGQMAVAQVIRDRCILNEQTVEEVVNAEGQFAEAYDGEISSTTEAAVGLVFEGGHNVFEVPVTHFYAQDLIDMPEWTGNLVFVEEIGGHSFFTELENIGGEI